MGDFDKLYSDTLQLLQENQIDDVNLEEVLRNPNFVELLRSLYQCNEDPEKIYISCVSQGFRMCDLQKAMIYKKNNLINKLPKSNQMSLVKNGCSFNSQLFNHKEHVIVSGSSQLYCTQQ